MCLWAYVTIASSKDYTEEDPVVFDATAGPLDAADDVSLLIPHTQASFLARGCQPLLDSARPGRLVWRSRAALTRVVGGPDGLETMRCLGAYDPLPATKARHFGSNEIQDRLQKAAGVHPLFLPLMGSTVSPPRLLHHASRLARFLGLGHAIRAALIRDATPRGAVAAEVDGRLLAEELFSDRRETADPAATLPRGALASLDLELAVDPLTSSTALEPSPSVPPLPRSPPGIPRQVFVMLGCGRGGLFYALCPPSPELACVCAEPGGGQYTRFARRYLGWVSSHAPPPARVNRQDSGRRLSAAPRDEDLDSVNELFVKKPTAVKKTSRQPAPWTLPDPPTAVAPLHLVFHATPALDGVLPAGSATSVLSHGMLSRLPTALACAHVREGLRLLRPGGVFVIWGLKSVHSGTRYHPSFFVERIAPANASGVVRRAFLPRCRDLGRYVADVELILSDAAATLDPPEVLRQTGRFAVRLWRGSANFGDGSTDTISLSSLGGEAAAKARGDAKVQTAYNRALVAASSLSCRVHIGVVFKGEAIFRWHPATRNVTASTPCRQ